MTHNNILRRIRDTFNYDHHQLTAIFAHVDCEVTDTQLDNWLADNNLPNFVACSDRDLAAFLNGWIIEKRGAKEGSTPMIESELTPNKIFQKMKIALALQAEDTLALLALDNVDITKRELSAYFRKAEQKHYKPCSDATLWSFVKGMQLHYSKATTS